MTGRDYLESSLRPLVGHLLTLSQVFFKTCDGKLVTVLDDAGLGDAMIYDSPHLDYARG